MAQRIYLVRHGETDWNKEGRAQGRREVPLNDKGREQAAIVGGFLSSFHPSYLVSSDQGRALETAEAIGIACGLPVFKDEAFRERDMGPYEGKTVAEIHSQRHRDLASWEGIDGVEQDDSIRQRVIPALKALVNRAGEDAVVVTHGGVVKVVVHHVLGLDGTSLPRRFALHNGLVVVLHWTGEHFLLDGLIGPHMILSSVKKEEV